MKNMHANSLLTFSVLTLTLWKAHTLAAAWFNSPYDRQGWVALIGWMLGPLLLKALRPTGDLHWLAAALVMSIAGTVADLSALHAFALALALASLARHGWQRQLWFVGFVSWTSALGWLLSGFSSALVIIVRLIIAALSCCPWFFSRRAAA